MTDYVKDAQDFIDHSGVKGMKWGVRRENKLQSLRRVGNGEGTRKDRIRTAFSVSQNDVKRNRGVREAAAAKADFMQGRKERIEAGKASVLDQLGNIGDIRVSELVRVKRVPKK